MSNLEEFRNQLRGYLSRVAPFNDGRKATQKDLASAIFLDPGELSKRLNGNGKTQFSKNDIKNIILQLATWEAITSRQQAEALLELMECKFTAAEWNAEPLSLLENKPNNLKRATNATKFKDTYSLQNKSKSETPVFENDFSVEITEATPLLLGIVMDVSHSAIDALGKTPKRSTISARKSNDVINFMVKKIIQFCQTDDAKEVLPKIALFAYGYGFGKFQEATSEFLQNLGLQKKKERTSSEVVRDLFSKAAIKENLPITPTAADLNNYWSEYRKGMEAEFIDMELGPSVLYEGLLKVYERFQEELTQPYYPNPILLIISDGQLHRADDEKLGSLISTIQSLGVQIISFYLAPKNIVKPKTLYHLPRSEWSVEAIRLFKCASLASDSNKVIQAMIDKLREKDWRVADQARLFIQVNQTELLEEVADALLSPLKDSD